MEIRLLEQDDLEALHRAFFVPPYYHKERKLFEGYFEEQKKAKREVYVAFDAAEVVGYVTLLWRSPYPYFAAAHIPEIKDLNVVIHQRRKGIGSRLIHFAEERARAAGYAVIGIGVGTTADYAAAARLYPALGYVPDGRGVYGEAEEAALYFSKSLNI